MVTSKIILLLRKLSKKDSAGFREFLRSPYFNKKEKLLEFYDKLAKHYPELDEKKINREKIYKSLYPGSKFNTQVYKNLSSELYSAAREFLAIEGFRSNKAEMESHLVSSLEHSGMTELYRMELKNMKRLLNESKLSSFMFYDRFKLAALEKTFYFNRGNFRKGLELSVDESNELLKFYFSQMFRIVFDFEVSRLNFNMHFEKSALKFFSGSLVDKGVLKDTLEYFEKNEIKNHEIIVMYYNIMMALMSPLENAYFNKAKELMTRNLNKFEKSEQFIMPSSLLTVCTFKINLRGDNEDYRNAFEIINFQLKKKIYKETPENFITATEFRNIFMIGIYLKEFDWLKKFLKKYIDEVNPAQKENLQNLLKGYLKFFDGDFEESLNLISLVKFEQNIFKLDVRKLQLLNYYELGHLESALSLVNSFKEFLSSNKNVTEDSKRNNSNFVNFVFRLLKLKIDFDSYGMDKLEKEIEETPYVLYRGWLEEKIGVLRKQDH